MGSPPSPVGKDNIRHVSEILPDVLEEFVFLLGATADPDGVRVEEVEASKTGAASPKHRSESIQ